MNSIDLKNHAPLPPGYCMELSLMKYESHIYIYSYKGIGIWCFYICIIFHDNTHASQLNSRWDSYGNCPSKHMCHTRHAKVNSAELPFSLWADSHFALCRVIGLLLWTTLNPIVELLILETILKRADMDDAGPNWGRVRGPNHIKLLSRVELK